MTSDNTASMMGYTLAVQADAEDGSHSLFLLVQPDFDPEAMFRAWDTDEQEWLNVKGFHYTITALEAA